MLNGCSRVFFCCVSGIDFLLMCSEARLFLFFFFLMFWFCQYNDSSTLLSMANTQWKALKNDSYYLDQFSGLLVYASDLLV